LLAEYTRYQASGEVNSEVEDQAAATEKVRKAFAAEPGVSIDDMDGMTVAAKDWWFNLRPSNTEPLLRLNVEAADEPAVARILDEVLELVRS
jgi:phosphomannomutase